MERAEAGRHSQSQGCARITAGWVQDSSDLPLPSRAPLMGFPSGPPSWTRAWDTEPTFVSPLHTEKQEAGRTGGPRASTVLLLGTLSCLPPWVKFNLGNRRTRSPAHIPTRRSAEVPRTLTQAPPPLCLRLEGRDLRLPADLGSLGAGYPASVWLFFRCQGRTSVGQPRAAGKGRSLRGEEAGPPRTAKDGLEPTKVEETPASLLRPWPSADDGPGTGDSAPFITTSSEQGHRGAGELQAQPAPGEAGGSHMGRGADAGLLIRKAT